MTGWTGPETTVVLGLAWFAVVNGAASLMALAVARLFEDGIAGDPRRARLLLALRLAPAASALLLSAGVFVPGHMRLEPPHSGERLGFVPLALALCGVLVVATAIWRFLTIAWASARLVRSARRVPGVCWIEIPVLRGIALAGIFRPRILIGTGARRSLTAGELDVAVAHELAHQHARDNLARVMMLCAPDLFGWTRAASRLEQLWEGEAECLADAAAVAGSALRATTLASALVKVARLGEDDRGWAQECSAFHHPALLETRVRRLLSSPPETPAPVRAATAAALVSAAAVSTAWMLQLPRELHWLTEALIALAP